MIVPGLGAFLSVRKSAEIDRDAGLIKCPYREICFNAAIVNNDGMIANSIARRDGVSFEKGESIVEKAVEELSHVLKTSGEVQIGSIGRLERRSDGRVAFIPRPIRRDSVRIARVRAQESYDVVAEQSAERKSPDYWYIPIHKKAAGIAASVTALVAVSMVMLLLMLKPSAPAIDMDKASVVPSEIASGVAGKLMDTPAQESAPEIKPVEDPEFYLIVGTFRSEKEAEVFVRQQEGKGQDLEIVAGGKLFRVSAASANSENELREKMKGAGFRQVFREAWIWKK